MRGIYPWILVAAFVCCVMTEAPYPPSGWRPKGPAFELPARIQSKTQTQQDSYLPQSNKIKEQTSDDTQILTKGDQQSTPSGEYGEPAKGQYKTLQGLPLQDAANFIQFKEESPVQVQKSISQSREYTDFNSELNLLQRQTKKQQETFQDNSQFQNDQTLQKQFQQKQPQLQQRQPFQQKSKQQTFSQNSQQVYPQKVQQQEFSQNTPQQVFPQSSQQNLIPQNVQPRIFSQNTQQAYPQNLQQNIIPQNAQQPEDFTQNLDQQNQQSLEQFQQNQQYTLPVQQEQNTQQQQYLQQQLALQHYKQLYQQPEQPYETFPQQQYPSEDLSLQQQDQQEVNDEQLEDQRLQDQQLNSFGQKLQPRQFAEYGAPPNAYVPPKKGALPVNPSTAVTPEEEEPTTASVNEGPNIAVSTAVADGRSRRFSARIRSRNAVPLFTVNRSGDLIRIY